MYENAHSHRRGDDFSESRQLRRRVRKRRYMALGSRTGKVLTHSKIPVLLTRQPSAGPAKREPE